MLHDWNELLNFLLTRVKSTWSKLASKSLQRKMSDDEIEVLEEYSNHGLEEGVPKTVLEETTDTISYLATPYLKMREGISSQISES